MHYDEHFNYLHVTTRDTMNRDYNIGYCVCCKSENGRVQYARNEGDICGMIVDGKTIEGEPTEEQLEAAAKIANPDYDPDYTAESNLSEVCKERGCWYCPFKDDCDAMDETDEAAEEDGNSFLSDLQEFLRECDCNMDTGEFTADDDAFIFDGFDSIGYDGEEFYATCHSGEKTWTLEYNRNGEIKLFDYRDL